MNRQNILFVIFSFTLCGIIIPHGGYKFHEASIFFILISLLFLTTGIKETLTELKLISFFWFLFILYNVTYIIQIDIETIRNIQKELAEDIAITSFQISYSKYNTVIQIIKNTIYFMTFLVSYTLLKSYSYLHLYLKTTYCIVVFISCYALLNFYTNGRFAINSPDEPWIWDWDKAAFGTFSYKNHFSILINLFIPIGIYLMTGAFRNQRNLACLFYFFSLVILTYTQVLTDSRGGIFILFLTLMILSIRNISVVKETTRITIKFLSKKLLLFIVPTTIFLSFIFTVELIDRGVSDSGRLESYKASLLMISENPFFGTGPGTYKVVQGMYKSSNLDVSRLWEHAHNDYLEFLATYGLIGTSLLLVILFSMLMRLLKKQKFDINDSEIRLYLGVSVLGMLIHAGFEWIFALPALTLHFMVLIAIIMNIDISNERKENY